MAFKTLDDVNVNGLRVLLRVDLNVPMEKGAVSDDTRLTRIVPTLQELSKKGAKIILLAHFGRPKGMKTSETLRPVADALAAIMKQPVTFANDCIGQVVHDVISQMKSGDIVCLENTRFHAGEEKNDPVFVKALAENGDIYVNDAFSCAHRAHASTEGLAHVLPAYAGRTMQAELEALGKALDHPQRPVIAVVGGAKVSSKIDLLENLITKVDALVIGGGMANTFLYAQGFEIGKSLAEKDLADTARRILEKATKTHCQILLPIDAVVASHFGVDAPHQTYPVEAIPQDGMILDAGAQSIALINAAFDKAHTLVWNGPLGAFELNPFHKATFATAQHAANLTKAGNLVSVAGGGDTVSALNSAHVSDDFTYISTAGGAFLEWMEGKPLPGVDVLKNKNIAQKQAS